MQREITLAEERETETAENTGKKLFIFPPSKTLKPAPTLQLYLTCLAVHL
jgi:hypothetical protein